MNRENI